MSPRELVGRRCSLLWRAHGRTGGRPYDGAYAIDGVSVVSVAVRSAEAKDKQACLELISSLSGRKPDEAWDATFDKLVSGKRGAILVAEDNGMVLGVATVSYNLAIRYGGEYCQLEELIVNEDARGKKAGAALIEAAVSSAMERGCAEIGLHLMERTEGNRSFYEKFGFEVVGSEMRQSLR